MFDPLTLVMKICSAVLILIAFALVFGAILFGKEPEGYHFWSASLELMAAGVIWYVSDKIE